MFSIYYAWSEDKKREVINQFKGLAHCLNYQCSDLVKGFASIPLASVPVDVLPTLMDLLGGIATLHVTHTEIVITQLVKHLVPVAVASSSGAKSMSRASSGSNLFQMEDNIYNHVHRLLGGIMNCSPLSGNLVIKVADTLFPFHTKSGSIVKCYVKNLIVMASYSKYIKADVIGLIVSRLVTIDTIVSKDLSRVKRRNGEFVLENIFKRQKVADHDKALKEERDIDVGSESLKETLDECLLLLIDYISQPFGITKLNASNQRVTWIASFKPNTDQDLAALLLPSLLNNVIPHFNLKSVPYLYFYAAAIHSPTRSTFLTELWKLFDKHQNVSSHNLAHSACFFLSDLISRLREFSINTCVKVLKEMASWILSYINKVEDKRDGKISGCGSIQHATFYVITQCFLFIFCYRYRELVEGNRLGQIQNLNVGKIIFCSLNPMKYINSEVAVAFSVIAKIVQLEYCVHLVGGRHNSEIQLFEVQYPFNNLELMGCQKIMLQHTRFFELAEEDETTIIDTINKAFNSATNAKESDDDGIAEDYLFLEENVESMIF
uniref:Nucleolar pre-ribosomal-associated protein 1 n=1 Tax=Rhabditophanes sp. KR3021 TaxID=114890 RepID=A0AC35TZM7_9BILA